MGNKAGKKNSPAQEKLVKSNLELAAASEKLAEEAARKNDVIERATDIQLFIKKHLMVSTMKQSNI